MSDHSKGKFRRRALIAGAAVGVLSSIALAAFLGSGSLAAYLGTTGGRITDRYGPGQGSGGMDLQRLVVDAAEDTSTNPSQLAGVLTYTADSTMSSNNIYRAKFAVRDPSSPSNPWVVVRDVTSPDSRIVNSSPSNTFHDTFTTADLASGFEYCFSVWDTNAASTPVVVMSGAMK